MAVLAASSVSACLTPVATASSSSHREMKPARKAVTMGRTMRSFAGMKPESKVSRLGFSESTEEHFARVVLAQARASGVVGRGAAAASTCNIAAEIFRVVPIMSGLVLVGIALGFVLLRVESAVEEAEE